VPSRATGSLHPGRFGGRNCAGPTGPAAVGRGAHPAARVQHIYRGVGSAIMAVGAIPASPPDSLSFGPMYTLAAACHGEGVSRWAATWAIGGLMMFRVLGFLRVLGFVGLAAVLVGGSTLLSGMVSGAATVGAGAHVLAPEATKVSSACWGGMGRISFKVYVLADGETYQVDVVARGLRDGSRWRVGIVSEQFPEPDREFKRRVSDGGWTATTQFGPREGDHTLYFQASAHERGVPHGCDVNSSLGAVETSGSTACGLPHKYREQAFATLAVQRTDANTIGVRFDLYESWRARRWHIELRTTEASTSQTLMIAKRASNGGHLKLGVGLRGYENPRLHVLATPPEGPGCRFGFNPADQL